jgi:hypothetical protein
VVLSFAQDKLFRENLGNSLPAITMAEDASLVILAVGRGTCFTYASSDRVLPRERNGRPGRFAVAAILSLATVVNLLFNSSRVDARNSCPNNFSRFMCPAVPSDIIVTHPLCIEANCVMRKVTVETGGELLVPDVDNREAAKTLIISVTVIAIKNGGIFQIGPVANRQVTLKFTGARPMQVVTDPGGPEDPCPSAHFTKGIEVCRGGTLKLLGIKGVPSVGGISWTYLIAPIGDPSNHRAVNTQREIIPRSIATETVEPARRPDSMTIQVATDVSKDWKPGDWIVIGNPQTAPIQTELTQVKAVTGRAITLSHPLKYYHFGSPMPLNARCDKLSGGFLPAELCGRSLDMNRTEVWLISRNIVLTSDAGQVGRENWGGEIRIHTQFNDVVVQGVQLENLNPDVAGALGNVQKLNAPSGHAPVKQKVLALTQPNIARPAKAVRARKHIESRFENGGLLLSMPGAKRRDSYRKVRR